MARDGYLILDSDLHMMEPDDLWACYLEGPHRASPPRFFGGQQRILSDSVEDKGNADTIMGMEVQGLAIPAHAKATAATASSRELRRRSRARHPHFQLARGRGFDADSTLTAMDIEGVDVAVMYGTRGRQILMHAADPEIVCMHTCARGALVKYHQLLSLLEAPQRRCQRADIHRLRCDVEKVREQAANLAIEHPDKLTAPGNGDAQQFLGC